MEALLASDWADALLVILPDFLYLYPVDEWDVSVEASEVSKSCRDQPIVFSIFGPRGPLTARLEAIENVVTYPSCERAVRAMARLCQYSEWLANQGTTA